MNNLSALCHDGNEFFFYETMMKYALSQTNTLSLIAIALVP